MSVADSTTALRPLDTGRNPAALCFILFAILAVVSHLILLARLIYWMAADELTLEVTSRDFVNYWMGARLALSGDQQELFAWSTYHARLEEQFGSDFPRTLNWGYPPHSLLLLWPLGYLEYRPALVTFLVVSFSMFAVALWLFRREYAPATRGWPLCVALVGFVVTVVYATQNGFLSAAAMLFGLAMMKRRPAWAGVAFALLTIKPQLGFLLPVMLACDRNWRAIGWSALFTVLLVGSSIACFGLASWQAYLTDSLAYQRHVMVNWEGVFLQMMPTTYGSARTLGFSPQIAAYAQLPVSIAGAVLVAWLLWRESDPLRRVFVLVCGTFLITPYALNYDMGALSVAAALLALSGALQNRGATLIMSVVAVLAGAVMHLGLGGLPLAPVILAAGLGVIARSTWQRTHMPALPAARAL